MRRPLQRTLINLAVASACGVLSMAAHAQQADQTQTAQGGDAASTADQASPVPTTAASTNTVVVSGSRIATRGFSQPTPTTTLTAEDLAKAAKPNLFETLVELPALQGSMGRTTNTNSTSSGLQGLSSLSLRGLGAIRTLTLLDGQRVIAANITGVTDVSQFPQLLVKRVDVVTGGASASYGSDAVGGVVNFITDKKFNGFKFNVEGGETKYHDDKNGTVQAAWGSGFLNDKLHVEVSGEITKENGIDSPGFGASAANGRTWFANPALQESTPDMQKAGAPRFKSIQQAQQIQYAKYGLITNGPLKGTTFDSSGNPVPFQYGTNCIGNFCQGGDLSGSVGAGTNLAMNFKRQVAYSRISWDLDENNEIYVTGNWAQVKSVFSPNPGAAKQANLTIQCDNAYLPASLAAGCSTSYPKGIQFGTANAEFPANINVHPTRTQRRFVVGADGRFTLFGKDWAYDSYYEHGENTTVIHVQDITLNPHFNNAYDAIKDPVTGQIVCRNTTARAAGCQPLNLFGNVPINMAAWNYIAPANGPMQHTDTSQNVVSGNVSGDIAEGWAGPISMALGAEWRREDYAVHGDPYGAGITSQSPLTPAYPNDPTLNLTQGDNWYAGNYHNGQGAFNVKEAYVEFNVPLFKSDALGSANLNVADRQERYSTAGHASAWKIGATWKTPVDGLSLRAVSSQDVRAPNLSELYAAMTVTNNTVNNKQGVAVQIQQRNVGNPNLVPEIGRNNSFGIVLSQPSWAKSFSFSVDYYDIKIKNQINSLSPAQINDLCNAGNQTLCAAVSLDTPPGVQPYILAQSFNFASTHNKGIDFETAYRKNLADYGMPGTFTVHGLLNRTIHNISDPGVAGTIPSEGAGNMQGSTPKWKALLTEGWDNGKVGLNLTQRWVSAGVFSNEYIECQTNCPASTTFHPTIYDNHLPGAFYLDFGATWNLGKESMLYFKIDNLLDRAPVLVPQTNLSYGINPGIYDVVGRTYRAGLRMTF